MTADEACPTGNQDRHLALTLAGVHVSYCPADEFGIKRFMAWQKIDRSLFALPLGRGQFPLRQRLNLLKVRSGLMLKRSFSLPHISCWACGLWLCDTLRGTIASLMRLATPWPIKSMSLETPTVATAEPSASVAPVPIDKTKTKTSRRPKMTQKPQQKSSRVTADWWRGLFWVRIR